MKQTNYVLLFSLQKNGLERASRQGKPTAHRDFLRNPIFSSPGFLSCSVRYREIVSSCWRFESLFMVIVLRTFRPSSKRNLIKVCPGSHGYQVCYETE
jgi:hypothetical protein